MADTAKDLSAERLIECIGQPIMTQIVFLESDLIPSSNKDKEEYFPLMIDYTLSQPNRFSIFGVIIDELHLKVDKDKKIVAIFAKLDNQHLVEKMEKIVGEEYMASGVSVGNEPAANSYFNWDYNGKCVVLNLNAHKVQFKPKIVRDYGLVIFNNCDLLSYISVPTQ
jgi:hypothetical protein